MTDQLSVEQAVGLLSTPESEAAPIEEVAPPEQEEQHEIEAQPGAEDGDGAEAPTEPEAVDEPERPAIDPPHFWSAEAKARFAELPADLQEVVLAQERDFQRVSRQKLEEAATQRKEAETRAKALQSLTEGITHAAQ